VLLELSVVLVGVVVEVSVVLASVVL
jgi:hypothetical protein